VDCSVSVVDRTASTVTLRFAVCDTGIGIAADKLSTVFEAFAQADTSTTRRFGGTGLGLSISTRLVELMRGHLDVRSDLGKGSVFSFTLTLDVAESLPVNPAGDAISDRPTGKLSLRILLVEDNPINQMLAMRLLEKWGHCVTLAANGQIAMDTIANGERFELVLMDMQMPVMGGIEATRRLRLLESQKGWPALPVVAMTANAMESDRKACMEAGMDDFLSKPIDHAALAAVLGALDGVRA
jgi:CheY-like chemotaxis protein